MPFEDQSILIIGIISTESVKGSIIHIGGSSSIGSIIRTGRSLSTASAIQCELLNVIL